MATVIDNRMPNNWGLIVAQMFEEQKRRNQAIGDMNALGQYQGGPLPQMQSIPGGQMAAEYGMQQFDPLRQAQAGLYGAQTQQALQRAALMQQFMGGMSGSGGMPNTGIAPPPGGMRPKGATLGPGGLSMRWEVPKAKERVLNSFLDKKGDPATWSPKTIQEYTKIASDFNMTNLRPLSKEAVEALNMKAQMVATMGNLNNKLKGKQFTGVLKGRFNKMLDALGAADPETATFVQELAQTAEYLRQLAGAAFTETERKLYEPMFPGMEDNPQAFIVKARGLSKMLERKLRGESMLYNQQNYHGINADALIDLHKGMMGLGSKENVMKLPGQVAKPSKSNKQIMINPKTGKMIELKDGKWVPVR